MSDRKQKNTKTPYLLALALFLPVLVVLELLSLVSGFAAFPLKTIQCGHQPYIASDFAASYSYTKPGDVLYKGPNIFTKPNDFYCTEAEAQAAGYRPDIKDNSCSVSSKSEVDGCSAGGDPDAIIPFITYLVITAVLISYLLSLGILRYKHKKTAKI